MSNIDRVTWYRNYLREYYNSLVVRQAENKPIFPDNDAEARLFAELVAISKSQQKDLPNYSEAA